METAVWILGVIALIMLAGVAASLVKIAATLSVIAEHLKELATRAGQRK